LTCANEIERLHFGQIRATRISYMLPNV
jgi:hypothetical protein